MGNKLDWRKAKIYNNDPNFNSQPYTKELKKADRKWIKKQRKKEKKIEALKNGEVRKRKNRGRMSLEERRARRKARRDKYAKYLEGKLDEQLSRHLQN